jgi:hypothetical protein
VFSLVLSPGLGLEVSTLTLNGTHLLVQSSSSKEGRSSSSSVTLSLTNLSTIPLASGSLGECLTVSCHLPLPG